MRIQRLLVSVPLLCLAVAVFLLLPFSWLPPSLQSYYVAWFGEPAYEAPPSSQKVTIQQAEPFCPDIHPEWRKAQEIEGVTIDESLACAPDNPWAIAAFVKGTNNVSMDTLMKSGLAADAVVMGEDKDGDGDPDVVTIKLEVVELNGHSPDIPEVIPAFFIAPGIQPGLWVFAPKIAGMATKNADTVEANEMLRAPSPVIRVEQGDTVRVVLENTHYFPHTIHFHGVDHPYSRHENQGNDGAPETSELPVMPGESRVYEFSQFANAGMHMGHGEVDPGQTRAFEMAPRQPGTMFYHCHVQPQHHIHMGLQGMFVVEENRPSNWVQTLNVGAGQVRHPSVAVREKYTREYDLHFQDIDSRLNDLIKTTNDPRVLEQRMNRQYNITQRRANYFLLNGRSFPYTFRESLVVVEPNEKVKLRVLSGGEEGVSLHTHGHKVTITHYDGVEHNPQAQITRDVVWLSTAQRVDLELNTTNDGLHSYGPGVWMLHDHKERAFTNDGMHPGGSMSAVVDRSYLDEHGWPKTQGVDWAPFFTPQYYRREIPVWTTYDPTGMWDQPAAPASHLGQFVLLGFVIGAFLGGFMVFQLFSRKRG